MRFPSPVQIREWGRELYAQLDELGEPVTIMVAAPGNVSFDEYLAVALVAAYRREELVPGGPLEQGDLKALFNAASFPVLPRSLERCDRVLWRGALYAVMNQDDATRTGAGAAFGIELQLRGG
jgi:hypothetical protein